jgi:hypothetical protein
MQCPRCGDSGLHIDAKQEVTVQLHEDGTNEQDRGNIAWESQDRARCDRCDWKGTVSAAEKAYKTAARVASDALGYEVNDLQLDEVYQEFRPAQLPQLRKDLKTLEIAFEAAGGRGVEQADEIDLLRVAIAVLPKLKKPRHTHHDGPIHQENPHARTDTQIAHRRSP